MKLQESEASQSAPESFRPRFHWRVLGTPTPVFPGFEIDICDRISDDQQPDFVWHRERARNILRDHPEVKQLFGRSPSTAFWCLGLAGAQLTLAALMGAQSWWVMILVAYAVGSMINIGLFNLAHECNHSLIFRDKRANRWLFTLTSMPMMLPLHDSWWIEHHVHHNHLGSKKDFIKRRRSILLMLKDRLFGYLPGPAIRRMTTWITTPLFWPIAAFMLTTQLLRAVVGLIVYAVTALLTFRLKPSQLAMEILTDQHLVSGYRRYKIELWAVGYPLVCLSVLTALVYFFGWFSLIYLYLSALFFSGFLQPLTFGLILSNSHFHGHRIYQPSSSYYGWMNWITFNFGLHTEHHDFANIPYHRLSALRKLAPEYYDNLKQTRSFAWLALLFAFGSRENFNNEDYRNAEMFNQEGVNDSGNSDDHTLAEAFQDNSSDSESQETVCSPGSGTGAR
jgi:sphingolipid delta-4 desaturase